MNVQEEVGKLDKLTPYVRVCLNLKTSMTKFEVHAVEKEFVLFFIWKAMTQLVKDNHQEMTFSVPSEYVPPNGEIEILVFYDEKEEFQIRYNVDYFGLALGTLSKVFGGVLMMGCRAKALENAIDIEGGRMDG